MSCVRHHFTASVRHSRIAPSAPLKGPCSVTEKPRKLQATPGRCRTESATGGGREERSQTTASGRPPECWLAPRGPTPEAPADAGCLAPSSFPAPQRRSAPRPGVRERLHRPRATDPRGGSGWELSMVAPRPARRDRRLPPGRAGHALQTRRPRDGRAEPGAGARQQGTCKAAYLRGAALRGPPRLAPVLPAASPASLPGRRAGVRPRPWPRRRDAVLPLRPRPPSRRPAPAGPSSPPAPPRREAARAPAGRAARGGGGHRATARSPSAQTCCSRAPQRTAARRAPSQGGRPGGVRARHPTPAARAGAGSGRPAEDGGSLGTRGRADGTTRAPAGVARGTRAPPAPRPAPPARLPPGRRPRPGSRPARRTRSRRPGDQGADPGLGDPRAAGSCSDRALRRSARMPPL